MTRWFHLFPSRTQQLSTAVAKVSAPAGRIARCRAFFFYKAFLWLFLPKNPDTFPYFWILLRRESLENTILRMSYAYGII